MSTNRFSVSKYYANIELNTMLVFTVCHLAPRGIVMFDLSLHYVRLSSLDGRGFHG